MNELLAQQANFNWITHTWSHLYLGCTAFQRLPLDHVTAGAGASLAAGSYSYEVTAATAYGESEPSLPQTVTVGTNGSVSLSWPDATNGGGPTLAQEEASHTGGTGFWGYHIYRAPSGTTSFGLIGSVPEDATGATPNYSFTDIGATPPAGAPESSDTNPTATNPGMGCAGTGGADWVPATSTDDSSIGQEVGLDDAFAANNGLTNFSPASLVTGEHSGLENPNLATALQGLGVTTIAADASRQPQQYNVAYPNGTGQATTAPRYPSNIYYNASNWPDQVNEYNTLYVAPGTPIGTGTETGRCQASSATTCLNTPATEQSILASESSIMLSHLLANNPRIGYAHQTNLIGPATRNGQDYGYTLLGLISNTLAQYHTWTNAPLEQMTDASSARVLAEQAAWASSQANNPAQVTAVQSGPTITLTNTGTSAATVPVTVPPGSTVNGAAFGQPYAGTLSDWVSLAAGASETVTIPTASPVFTSPASTSFNVNAAGAFTVTATGTPTPVLTENGTLPAGVSFVDNHDGTAAISGTPTVSGSFPVTLAAANAAGTPTQSFTLNVNSAPAITSAGSATAIAGLGFSSTVTTTGFPAPSLTETGALPGGVAFVDHGNGTATLSGTPAAGSGGSYPLVLTASSSAGTTTQNFTLTDAEAPTITSPAAAAFSTGVPQAFTVIATGYPTAAINQTGSLPAGVSFTDNGNGTATITGTPGIGTAGVYPLTITASNPTAVATATQTFSLTVTAASAPLITSGPKAFFTVGQAGGAFAVTTKGSPTPAISETGTLPAGLTFVDAGNGTAVLSGQPTATGTTDLSITAHNPISPDATQTLSVVVGQAPAFTSRAAVPATAGVGFTFAITTSGYPAPTIGESGSLPGGMTFTDNGDGTATISGTATAGGVYPLNLTAANGTGTTTQTLLLTVVQAPAITSAGSATFAAGTPGTFPVTATGSPAAALSESGPLPAGVTFTDLGNGTAGLAGIPAAGSGGAYPITISATNSAGSTSQAFTLTVTAAPAITSAPSASFTVGQPVSFTMTASGYPAPKLAETGTLPAGIIFTDQGNGTATLTGTLTTASVGSFPLTISAANSTAAVAQTFTLTVTTGTLQITSPASTTFIAGQSSTFTVTATGTTIPTLSERGGLPPGVTFTASTNGSATLSGTPAATASGVYPINLVAANSVGSTSQAFTLTVDQTPTITSPTSGATITETAGTAFGFNVTTRAYPTASLSESGTLPSGVTFKDNGNSTATISGTGSAGSTTVTVTASNGISPNATTTFTLTVKPAATTGASVPAFTSPASATETVGAAFDFKVTTAASSQSATVTTKLSRTGTLPPGVRFSNNGDGTADITGPATSGGVFTITIIATNSAGADHPIARPHRRQSAQGDQRGRRHRHRRDHVRIHRQDQRLSPASNHRDRRPAGRDRLHRQRKRNGHLLRNAQRHDRRGVQAHDLGPHLARDIQPNLHPHRPPGPGLHQRLVGHCHPWHSLQLEDHHHRLPGADPHSHRDGARADLDQQRVRHIHTERDPEDPWHLQADHHRCQQHRHSHPKVHPHHQMTGTTIGAPQLKTPGTAGTTGTAGRGHPPQGNEDDVDRKRKVTESGGRLPRQYGRTAGDSVQRSQPAPKVSQNRTALPEVAEQSALLVRGPRIPGHARISPPV